MRCADLSIIFRSAPRGPVTVKENHMTNEAISTLLEHLSNEARNSVHATFGMMDLLRDAVADRTLRTAADLGRSSADRLLCSLDDFRDLLSPIPESIGATEEF